MAISKGRAYRDAVLKWRYIVGNDGKVDGLVDKYPHLGGYIANCSYCSMYLGPFKAGCKECPIGFKDRGAGVLFRTHCNHSDHPFSVWDTHGDRDTAEDVLNLILDRGPGDERWFNGSFT